MVTKKSKNKTLLDELLANGNVAKLLVIAAAGVLADQPDTPYRRSDFQVGWGRLIRALANQRSVFTAELRKMENVGPREYLRRVGRKMQQVGE